MPPGPYAQEVDYTERNLRMTESRIKELEDRKRPLRDRLRGSDINLDRAVALRDDLRDDMAHRRRQHGRDEGFADRRPTSPTTTTTARRSSASTNSSTPVR